MKAIHSARMWRKSLSKLRDQIMTVAGRSRGFFIPYRWASDVVPLLQAYPEVEEILERSDWQEHLQSMASHLETFRAFGSSPEAPRMSNSRMFAPLDGAATYAAITRFKPRRIIEIGSGDSTYFLAAAARELDHEVSITCIDPAPRRTIDSLPVRIEKRAVSTADANLCAQLEPNDILFIDSSHILLPGMDVDIEFNWMFPRLKPGVVVHVHDIFLPDSYPSNWTYRNYNEQQALIGWICGGFFEVIYPGHYVASRHPVQVAAVFGRDFPGQLHASGSIWLRRAPEP